MTSIVEGAGPRVPAIPRRRDDESGDRLPPEHTVLGRSAAIMDAFNGPQRVLSLADLNKRTRLPKSTLHRLVDQLCQVGWLERDHGGYRVGLRMFEFGTLAVDGNRLHDAAFPHLQRWRRAPGWPPSSRSTTTPRWCTWNGSWWVRSGCRPGAAGASPLLHRAREGDGGLRRRRHPDGDGRPDAQEDDADDHRARRPPHRDRARTRSRGGVRPRRGLRGAGMRRRADPLLRSGDRGRLRHRARNAEQFAGA